MFRIPKLGETNLPVLLHDHVLRFHRHGRPGHHLRGCQSVYQESAS